MSIEPADTRPEITDNSLLDGRLRLRQLRRGHRFGTDAVLLAALAARQEFERAVDLGAGVGAAGLALALYRPQGIIVLVEIEPLLARLAEENAALNGFAAQVAVVAGDVESAGTGGAGPELVAGSADLVLMNPPFHSASSHRRSEEPLRAQAHAADDGLLERWIAAAARLLRSRGRLVLIHRADGLRDVLKNLAPRFGGVAVRPVHPRADAPATRILVEAIRGGKAPLQLLPGLVLHEADGRFTQHAEALHRGDPQGL
jgi:tRNA1(Val) A37 N6-methylase TrmN6